MSSGIIGYSGFVGSNIAKQKKFDAFYNSKNIHEIRGQKFDILVCAAPSAVKWRANQNPEYDLKLVESLISNLQYVKVKTFIHISTVDVYLQPAIGNEDVLLNAEANHPYGRHRYYLEEFVQSKFKNFLIVRLPGLFGDGLKKNFIFDLYNNSNLELTHYQSTFQFYNLNNIWKDIQIALANKLSLVNFATEQVTAQEVALKCFNKEFYNITVQPPVFYGVQTKFADCFNGSGGYLYSKSVIIKDIIAFKDSLKV